MRITGGAWRSRIIEAPTHEGLRPTSDKVRQAIMTMLEARGLIEGASVLDIFCGTGALGLETLSRGAEKCIFIDNNNKSLELAKLNAQNLKAENATFIMADGIKLPVATAQANLVFLDPPYHKNLIQPCITSLQEKNWLAQDCILCIETEIDAVFENVFQEKIYGDTKVSLIQP
ncbi:MAG: 16S rRNA (guanine(966)-N(2))-methyltransferase RsmD [Alphaproteobacteria bacterium]|nr:16S rRNA (guanine(966)-N(2))-methyltransferase RsmD [Alphaproteobacteria bacterium]